MNIQVYMLKQVKNKMFAAGWYFLFCKVNEIFSQMKPSLFLSLIPGHAVIPKYYYVPADFVEAEQNKHGSQKRFPSNSGRDGKIFLWGQALYHIARLLGMPAFGAQETCIYSAICNICQNGKNIQNFTLFATI